MIISIDGPAGSGKSTVARELALRLRFLHFNSGSLYRAITAHLLTNNINLNSDEISNLNLGIKFIYGEQRVFVNNIDYTDYLRDNEISKLTPTVSQNPYIRNLIDKCQREFCSQHNCVIDGRDIGSFVFPNADIKFYLDCNLHERAKRRFEEEKKKNSKITLKEIENQLKIRDKIDKNKKIAPLVIPKDAIIINSTNLSISEVVDEMLRQIN